MRPFAVNPYNFQVPVTNPKAFAGRRSHRKDIEYYLDQALRTRPTNIAVVGPRAAGKTSLLNVIARDAAERGLVVVRINFDEGHARSQLRFFFKMFDAIVGEVVKQRRPSDGARCFGGRGGRFFQLYAQCVGSFEQANLEELDLIFPNFYAAAMKAGNEDRLIVPQSFFEDDLRRIGEEVGRPIALLMDECNVFVQNREILQAMRCIFQSLESYMMIMTGTNEMFPVIDDVYSPVGRGFKRIEVRGFEDCQETFACIERPLLAAGISADILDSFRPRSGERGILFPEELRDLHRFTSGNPHEIQLVCHFMFRELQERVERGVPVAEALASSFDLSRFTLGDWAINPTRLHLSNEVLSAVISELTADQERKQSLGIARSVDRSGWLALCALSRIGFGLSISQYNAILEGASALGAVIAFRVSDVKAKAPEDAGAKAIEIFLSPVSRTDLQRGIDGLRDASLIAIGEDGFVRWKGSQLDELLAKYIARTEGITLGDFGTRVDLRSVLRQVLAQSSALGRELSEHWWSSHEDEASAAASEWLAIFGTRLEVVTVGLRAPLCGSVFCTCAVSLDDPRELDASRAALEEFRTGLDMANGRSAGSGVEWSLRVGSFEAEPGALSDQRPWLSCLRVPDLIREPSIMTAWHGTLCDHFISGGKVRPVIDHALIQLRDIPAFVLPNLGFMAVAVGHPGARVILDASTEEALEPLMLYNRALSLLVGMKPRTQECLDELLAVPASAQSDFRAVLQVRVVEDRIQMYEVRPTDESPLPPLDEIVREAAEQLRKLSNFDGPVRVDVARPAG